MATNTTVNQINAAFADTQDRLTEDIAGASSVLNDAQAALNHGQQENASHTNSGMNTTVAKDSNGNAIGTYDWEAQAEHTAKISYNSDVLSAKQNATSTKQELVTNQQKSQTQYDMAGYSANQSAEKAGWTGGYVLDSNRQVAFLKESIKANLYSQEELQKYGYDTALAAARANYDLKKSELAMQNYNTAIQNSFQMAELTGKFVSPETSFHISQKGMAEQILSDPTASADDKARAQEIVSSVDSWFASNNISKEGVYCISVLMDNYNAASTTLVNLTNALTTNQSAWNEYKMQLISIQETVDTRNEDSLNTGLFSYVNEYGDITTISADYAVAASSSENLTNILNSLPADAQTAYRNILNNFATQYVAPIVTSAMANFKASSEEDAKKYAEAQLKDALKNFGTTDILIRPFNVECTIGDKKVTITLGGDTIDKCNEAEDYTGTSDSTDTPEDNTITVPDLEELGGQSNEVIEDAAQDIIIDNLTQTGNGNAHEGDDIIIYYNGKPYSVDGKEVKFEYDKDYGDTTSELLKIFFSDTNDKAYIAAKEILAQMPNDSYAVLPVPVGNGTKYAVIVKDKQGHYSFIRDKSASTEGSPEIATSKTIQDLAKWMLETKNTGTSDSTVYGPPAPGTSDSTVYGPPAHDTSSNAMAARDGSSSTLTTSQKETQSSIDKKKNKYGNNWHRY